MLAEYAVLNEDGLVKIPEHLTYEEAATLPCAAVTTWHAIVSAGNLAAGEAVLTLGTGGVSIFALQFAKMFGARVISTSSSDAKIEHMLAMGASDGINYKTTLDWEKPVRAMTGTGVDHVVEVGGAGTLEKSMKAVRAGGTIALIGVLTGGSGEVNPRLLLMKGIRMNGIYVGSRAMFEAMNRAITLHKLRPVVDKVFPFADAVEAYKYLESGAHFGKVVIGF
jgi:NADPH:quinone reductase-like Zn-dependent oxidoreductase